MTSVKRKRLTRIIQGNIPTTTTSVLAVVVLGWFLNSKLNSIETKLDAKKDKLDCRYEMEEQKKITYENLNSIQDYFNKYSMNQYNARVSKWDKLVKNYKPKK